MQTIQGYVYTLPEQFIEDKSVPFRWKLFALINGFWLSGKPVFASNAFFADKIGCSERHIQQCLDNLEEMGLLERVGVSQNRIIVPRGTNAAFTPQTKGDELGVPKGTNPALTRISESISERIPEIGISDSYSEESDDLDVSIVETDEDGNEVKRRAKKAPGTQKNKLALSLVHVFTSKVRQIHSSVGVNKGAGYLLILKALDSGLSEQQLINHINDWFDSKPDAEAISITACFSTHSINQFRMKEGL